MGRDMRQKGNLGGYHDGAWTCTAEILGCDRHILCIYRISRSPKFDLSETYRIVALSETGTEDPNHAIPPAPNPLCRTSIVKGGRNEPENPSPNCHTKASGISPKHIQCKKRCTQVYRQKYKYASSLPTNKKGLRSSWNGSQTD